MKKRILFHTEASFLSSGFAIYAHNILKRLHDSGKYDVAEFAIYANEGEERTKFTPWMMYPVAPARGDEEYAKIYGSNPYGQFGMFKFEAACLDFKPDIVMSIFDFWYSSYIARSPFRNFFKFAWMPTVDSRPQRPSWLDTYKTCDKILAYSYFGKNVLEEESNNQINDIIVASPGIDDSYEPSDTKENLRKKLGIPQDAKIVMMVCRNQMRKLIPDFLETLPIYYNKYSRKKSFSNNTFFYIHTSNPDDGWDLAQAIQETGMPNRILTTYICKECKTISISVFRGNVCQCEKCKKISMHMTNVSKGVPREALQDIMSVADIGVLMSIGEGWGMPLVEFKKAGVPVISVPYSATEEQVRDIDCGEPRHLGGFDVKIDRFYTESRTMQKRALFDKDSLAKRIYQIFSMSDSKYKDLCDDAKKCADELFTWDRAADAWMKAIDSIDVSDNLKWEAAPQNLYQPLSERFSPPQDIINHPDKLVDWLVESAYPHPCFTDYRKQELVDSLVSGADLIDGFNKSTYNLEKLFGMFNSMIEKHNVFEDARIQNFMGKYINKDNDKEMEAMII